jgi:uncharacterized membrane protein
MNKQDYFILGLAMAYASLTVLGASLIKSQVTGIKLESFIDYFNFLIEPKVIIGMVVIFLSAMVLFKALSIGNFNFVIPLSTGINFLLTACVGFFVFSEKLSAINIVGIGVILVGIVLLSQK